MSNDDQIDDLWGRIRECRHCADKMPHSPRPVLRPSATARICVAGQAPGTRVHKSGIPFTDPSGDRLRDWMGIDEDVFYDQSRVAILPMGFCFPGLDAKGGDKPPLKPCAKLWRDEVIAAHPQVELYILIGKYAQDWHLGKRAKPRLFDTVAAWRDYGPLYMPMPHPSWRNTGWLNKNPWFADEVLPVLRRRVQDLI